MNDKLELHHCGCGGEAFSHFIPLMGNLPSCFIYCKKCGIKTIPFQTESEAITAWNTAMGERTTKVGNQIFNNSNPYTVGAWIGTCECGELVSYSSKYCHMCGAKLDWSGNE